MKNAMKKLMSLVLVAVLLVSAVPFQADATEAKAYLQVYLDGDLKINTYSTPGKALNVKSALETSGIDVSKINDTVTCSNGLSYGLDDTFYLGVAGSMTTLTATTKPASSPVYIKFSYDAQNGQYGEVTAEHNSSILAALPTVTKAGFTFIGWRFGDQQLTADSPVTGELAGKTVYGYWSANPCGKCGSAEHTDAYCPLNEAETPTPNPNPNPTPTTAQFNIRVLDKNGNQLKKITSTPAVGTTIKKADVKAAVNANYTCSCGTNDGHFSESGYTYGSNSDTGVSGAVTFPITLAAGRTVIDVSFVCPGSSGSGSNNSGSGSNNSGSGTNNSGSDNSNSSTYTVKFFLDSSYAGTWTVSVPVGKTVSSDDVANAAYRVTTPSGYTFAGWQKNKTGDTLTTNNVTQVAITGDTAFYPVFIKNTSNKFPYPVYLNIYKDTLVGSPDKQVEITSGIALDGIVSLNEVKTVVMNYYTAKNSYGIGFDGLYLAKGNWVSDYVNDTSKYSSINSESLSQTGTVYINVMISNATAKTTSTADTTNPKTGDSIYTAVTVMGVSAAALATALYFYNKKRQVA